MSTIFLKDHKEIVLNFALEIERNSAKPNSYFNEKEIREAVEAQINDNLRYNKKSGITRNTSDGITCKYVYKKDIPKYSSSEECAKWEFLGFVRNSASRKKRGYSLI